MPSGYLNNNSDNSMFEQIYRLAKENKINELIQLKTTHAICIDVYSFGPFGLETPAGKLARKGKFKAVQALLFLGANNDRVAQGLILGGHTEIADSFLQKYNPDIDLIAYAAAMACDHELVKACRDKGAHINMIASGYAAAKEHKKVEVLFGQGADPTWIAKGYIIAKEHDLVERYVKHKRANAGEVAKFYALAGDLTKAEYYQFHYANNQTTTNKIAQGLAMGGYLKTAKQYHLDKKADINEISTGLLITGRLPALNDYLSLPEFNGNLIPTVLAYHDQHDALERFAVNPQLVAEGYALGGNMARLEATLVKHNILPSMKHATQLWNSGRFKNVHDIYAELASLNNEKFIRHLTELFVELMARNKVDVGFPEFGLIETNSNSLNLLKNSLVEKVLELRSTMLSFDLHYSQALAYRNPKFRGMLVEGMMKVERKEMSLDKLVRDLQLISPLSEEEIDDLYYKITLDSSPTDDVESEQSNDNNDQSIKQKSLLSKIPALFNRTLFKKTDDTTYKKCSPS